MEFFLLDISNGRDFQWEVRRRLEWFGRVKKELKEIITAVVEMKMEGSTLEEDRG